MICRCGQQLYPTRLCALVSDFYSQVISELACPLGLQEAPEAGAEAEFISYVSLNLTRLPEFSQQISRRI